MRTDILKKAEEHVHTIFREHGDADFVYHNEPHTEGVVKAAEMFSTHFNLNEEDHQVLIIAAWFHDIGYFQNAASHEEAGATLAADFLKTQHTPLPFIERVRNCILATRIPQTPLNLVEQILCDSDLFHFGTEEFRERNKLMRKEFNRINGEDISKSTWTQGTLKLLSGHQFHTKYARSILAKGEKENISYLKEKLKEYKEEKSGKTEPMKDKDKKHEKSGRPDRGIETMFRITSNNHQRLSDMADNKAQIMITVNSIILSILISVLLRKLEEDPNLAIPAFMLLSVNLATIIFAILATRPHLSPGVFTQKEVDEKHANLLFFGNFYKMSLQDYTKGVLHMMSDSDYLYKSLIKDVHSQGVVLGKKYYLLRICYNIFMFGIIVSVLAFIIASIVSKKVSMG
jgi:predicted metal-dependent HD superfamily phosphohydrolase